MGRPSKLDDEVVARFIRAIAAGVFPETAARYAGFSPASYYRYMKGSIPAHAAFRERVVMAETELEIRLVGTIARAALNEPRWAAELLDRRFPARWRRTPVDAEGPGTGGGAQAPAAAMVPLDPALIEAIVPRLLEAGERLRNGSGAEPVDLGQFDTSPKVVDAKEADR